MEPIIQITILNHWKIRLTEKRYERLKEHLFLKLLGIVLVAIGVIFLIMCAKWTNEYHTEDGTAGVFIILIGVGLIIAG